MLPKLLFQSGAHGNFLSRSLSIASGVQKDFDFYNHEKKTKGAHGNTTFKKIVNHGHSFEANDIWCNIETDVDDLYILVWHVLYAGGEYGLDLLKINSYKDLWQFKDKVGVSKYHTQKSIFEQAEVFEHDGVRGMREFFKLMHRQSNGLLATYNKNTHNKNIQRNFKFKWFYNKDKFLSECKLLLQSLGYEYRVDISKKWEDFIKSKKTILQSKERVQYAFSCYANGNSIDISDFGVYEQAFLDHLIEQHLGYDIELWPEYPTDTRDIKPIQSQRQVSIKASYPWQEEKG
tara:strand:+ start:1211 stop:2080 length:870 start_codon:yes stop_codon:yes gene_type:complete